jgi:hypothetical protein
MRTIAWLIFFFTLVSIAACSASTPESEPDLLIQPDDFVVLPCDRVIAPQPCALVVAGGKRVLFGAPSGAAISFNQDELKQLDAVLLFSLRAIDIEGLDDVRNHSWRAGRDAALLVIGPAGLDDIVTALNKAYEQPDALRIVEDGIPPGGFDAAVLVTGLSVPGQVVFDTGDLRIERLSTGYKVFYGQAQPLVLAACGADLERDAGFTVSCAADTPDVAWPLSEPVILQKQ